MSDINQKISTSVLGKPKRDTAFAHQSALVLKDIVTQNGWAIKLGQGVHLKYEAWQTIGKYYGYTVKTGESVYVEAGDIKGFEAKAWVIDNKTGMEIGGAEAGCFTDEPNWKNKPLFQLKSMAQTRAGSKALRQILGFVVALAGYSPTPSDEMIVGEVKEVREELDDWKGSNEVEGKECTCGTNGKFHKLDCPARD